MADALAALPTGTLRLSQHPSPLSINPGPPEQALTCSAGGDCPGRVLAPPWPGGPTEAQALEGEQGAPARLLVRHWTGAGWALRRGGRATRRCPLGQAHGVLWPQGIALAIGVTSTSHVEQVWAMLEHLGHTRFLRSAPVSPDSQVERVAWGREGRGLWRASQATGAL